MIANGNKTTGAAAFLKSRPGLPGILGDGVEKSMLSLGDQLVVSATGFLSGVIVARYCSLAELGAYHLAISVLLILRGIQAELVTSPFAIYSYRRSDEQLDTYTGSVLVHQTVCILAAFLLLCALCLATLQGLTPTAFRAVMPALLFAGPMVLIREYCRQHSFARLQFDVAVVTDLSVLAIQLVGLYWVATASELTVSLAFWIIGAACGIACFTWWSASRPRFRVEPRQVISDWRQNWSFGRWALTSYLVCSTTPALMTWIVAWLRSEEEAGKLAACVTLIGLSNLFTTAIANFLTPKTAAVYATEGIIGLRRVCGKVTLLFGMVLGCFSALVFITGDWPVSYTHLTLPTTPYV